MDRLSRRKMLKMGAAGGGTLLAGCLSGLPGGEKKTQPEPGKYRKWLYSPEKVGKPQASFEYSEPKEILKTLRQKWVKQFTRKGKKTGRKDVKRKRIKRKSQIRTVIQRHKPYELDGTFSRMVKWVKKVQN